MLDWVHQDLYGDLTDYPPLMRTSPDGSIFQFDSQEPRKIAEPILMKLASRWAATPLPVELVADKSLLTATNPNSKWRLTSCMQKGIRRGDAVMSLNAANALYDIATEYAWKRLSVVTLEDVGFGCIPVMAVLAAISGKKTWREALDHRNLFLKCVLELTLSPKDRLACEIRMLAKYSPYKDEIFPELMQLATVDLMKVISDSSLSVGYRMSAAWMLAGTTKYEELEPHTTPEHALLYEALFRSCPEINVVTHYVMKRHAATPYAMWLGIPFILELMESTQTLEGHEVDLPAAPMVGKLWGVAYDQYTREGQSAIRYFNKLSDHDLVPFFKGMAHRERISALSTGIFVAEGAALNPILMYDGAASLRKEAIMFELLHAGIPYDRQEDFLGTIINLLPALNKSRRVVLEQSIANKNS